MEQRKKLGEIFVEQGLLGAKSVERVLALARNLDKRFGTVLEEMGLITGKELSIALAMQYGCKTVYDFAKYNYAPQLLDIIPAEVALEHMLFPLKREGDKLALALADPTNTRIVNNIAANNDLKIVPFVAPREELHQAICRHYFNKDVTAPSRKTVLIVEDDKLVVNLLGNYLSGDYQVYFALDGMEAYKEAISKKPHVILADKEMPKLGGYGLLDALRRLPETKAIPVLLVSGTTNVDAESEAFERGFFDFIPKPVKSQTLLTRVKRAIDFSEKQQYLHLR
jgi:CheY-like chemotaxis protein